MVGIFHVNVEMSWMMSCKYCTLVGLRDSIYEIDRGSNSYGYSGEDIPHIKNPNNQNEYWNKQFKSVTDSRLHIFASMDRGSELNYDIHVGKHWIPWKIKISFCPFCGSNLTDMNRHLDESLFPTPKVDKGRWTYLSEGVIMNIDTGDFCDGDVSDCHYTIDGENIYDN